MQPPSVTTTCPKCYVAQRPDAKFCSVCGASLASARHQGVKPGPSVGLITGILLAFCAVGLIVGVYGAQLLGLDRSSAGSSHSTTTPSVKGLADKLSKDDYLISVDILLGQENTNILLLELEGLRAERKTAPREEIRADIKKCLADAQEHMAEFEALNPPAECQAINAELVSNADDLLRATNQLSDWFEQNNPDFSNKGSDILDPIRGKFDALSDKLRSKDGT